MFSGGVNAGKIFLSSGSTVHFSADVSANQLVFAPGSTACFAAGSDIAVNCIQVKRPASSLWSALDSLFSSVGLDGILNIDISHLHFPEGAFAIRVDSNCAVSIVGEDTDPFLGTATDLFA